MNIEVNINPEEINKYVSEQILNSSIGKKVKEVIDSKLKSDYEFKNHIGYYVDDCIKEIIRELIDKEYREKITALVAQGLTPEILNTLANTAAERAVQKLNDSIQNAKYW